MHPEISIIVPALNEAHIIRSSLHAWQPYRAFGCELIVVDGGSNDDTQAIAASLADQCIVATRGRASQMNAGAEVAQAPLLWFMHADTLPPSKPAGVLQALRPASRDGWGFFRLRLDANEAWCRVLQWFINTRSRASGTGTGDQGIFCSRDLFRREGGFAQLDLMEDIELCVQLRRIVKPRFPGDFEVMTSSRRWRTRGVVKTIMLMWRLRLAWWLGANHRKLANQYRLTS